MSYTNEQAMAGRYAKKPRDGKVAALGAKIFNHAGLWRDEPAR